MRDSASIAGSRPRGEAAFVAWGHFQRDDASDRDRSNPSCIYGCFVFGFSLPSPRGCPGDGPYCHFPQETVWVWPIPARIWEETVFLFRLGLDRSWVTQARSLTAGHSFMLSRCCRRFLFCAVPVKWVETGSACGYFPTSTWLSSSAYRNSPHACFHKASNVCMRFLHMLLPYRFHIYVLIHIYI